MKRNLLYHLYPKRLSYWRWHVEQLIAHASAWNGRRIIVLVLDHWTVDEKEAIDALAPLNAEVLVRPNNAELGETTYFVETFKLLKSLDPEEATFYAHGKGVSREGGPLDPIKQWSKAMYVLNLGRIDIVEKKLATHSTIGAFRVQMPHSGSTWSFAGTFFWLKHSTIFSRNWSDIERGRWGVEGYPGRHLKFEESYAVTPMSEHQRYLPDWLYGSKGTGVLDPHIKQWQEWLAKEV